MTSGDERQLPFPTWQIARRGAACAGAGAMIAALAAGIVVVGGLGEDVRRILALPLRGWPRTPGAVLEIVAHNGRLALAVLVCAYLAPRMARRMSQALDVVLAAMLGYNTALVGAALGAYGTRLTALLALHVPLELAGMSLAGGTYISSRRSALTPRTLLVAGTYCGVLLLAAGLLETYTPLGGTA
jgi:hypothetical protein